MRQGITNDVHGWEKVVSERHGGLLMAYGRYLRERAQLNRLKAICREMWEC
jgi:hypothetical protein